MPTLDSIVVYSSEYSYFLSLRRFMKPLAGLDNSVDLAFPDDADTTDSVPSAAVSPLLHFDSPVLVLLSQPRPRNRGISTETGWTSLGLYPLAVGT